MEGLWGVHRTFKADTWKVHGVHRGVMVGTWNTMGVHRRFMVVAWKVHGGARKVHGVYMKGSWILQGGTLEANTRCTRIEVRNYFSESKEFMLLIQSSGPLIQSA